MFSIKECFKTIEPNYYEVLDLYAWEMDEEHKSNTQKSKRIRRVADRLYALQMSCIKD